MNMQQPGYGQQQPQQAYNKPYPQQRQMSQGPMGIGRGGYGGMPQYGNPRMQQMQQMQMRMRPGIMPSLQGGAGMQGWGGMPPKPSPGGNYMSGMGPGGPSNAQMAAPNLNVGRMSTSEFFGQRAGAPPAYGAQPPPLPPGVQQAVQPQAAPAYGAPPPPLPPGMLQALQPQAAPSPDQGQGLSPEQALSLSQRMMAMNPFGGRAGY